MKCNGCRVLRIRRCDESCLLRSCLQWIPAPVAQGHATLFLSGFYGRNELLARIATVPVPQRPAMFHSLLMETCGRAVNPVSGMAGLQASGNGHLCMMAFNTVMVGRVPRPLAALPPPRNGPPRPPVIRMVHNLADYPNPVVAEVPPPDLEVSGVTQEAESSGGGAEGQSRARKRRRRRRRNAKKPKLMNLFE